MPHNENGFGTTYYGACDRHDDSSFVTTEWIIFFHLPILPTHSYRVKHLGSFSYQGRYSDHTGSYNLKDYTKINYQDILGSSDEHNDKSSRTHTFVEEYSAIQVPLNVRQVIEIYIKLFFQLSLFVLVGWIALTKFNNEANLLCIPLLFSIPIILLIGPYFLYKAK